MSDPITELHYAMRAVVVRGVVLTTDDTGPEQVVSVQCHYGQQRTQVPVLQPFGFSSVAPADGAICHVLQTGSDPSDLVALPPSNPSAARMGALPEGDCVLYDAAGQRVWLSGGHIVRIDTVAGLQVSVAGKTVLDVTADGVAVTGNLSVSGTITAQQDVVGEHLIERA